MQDPRYAAEAPRTGPTRLPSTMPDKEKISGGAHPRYGLSVIVVAVPVINQAGKYIPADERGEAAEIVSVAWHQMLSVRESDRGFSVSVPKTKWKGVPGVLLLIVYNGPGRDDDSHPEQYKFFSAAGRGRDAQPMGGAPTPGEPLPSGTLALLPSKMSQEASRALMALLERKSALELESAFLPSRQR